MTANKIWGGRFTRGPAAIMEEINTSIDFDKRLAPQDLTGSQAHAAMLAAQGIITKSDADSIAKVSRPGRVICWNHALRTVETNEEGHPWLQQRTIRAYMTA